MDVIGAVVDHLEEHLRLLGVPFTTLRNSGDPGDPAKVIDFSVGPNYHNGKPLKQLYVACQLVVSDGEVTVIYGGMGLAVMQMADPDFPLPLEMTLDRWFASRLDPESLRDR